MTSRVLMLPDGVVLAFAADPGSATGDGWRTLLLIVALVCLAINAVALGVLFLRSSKNSPRMTKVLVRVAIANACVGVAAYIIRMLLG